MARKESMEGSVEMDNGGMPAPTVQDTSSQEETIETRDESETGAEGEETQTQDQSGEGEKQTVTDKGTKLDSDPLTASHQLLANAERKLKDYERVLGSPELLRKFAAESGYTLAEAKAELKDEVKETKKAFTPDRFKTAQDVADTLNEIQAQHEKDLADIRAENAKLKQGYEGMTNSRRLEQVASTMQSDITTIQSNYPELNPKDPAYDSELEKEISDMYADIDTDPETGKLTGKFSLAKLTDRVMKAAGRAKKNGSQQAQTEVRTKVAGRVVTSAKGSSTTAGEPKDAGSTIAQRIARATGNMK